MKHEEVMVVETAALELLFRGRSCDLIRDDAEAMLDLIAREHFFVPREAAESEPKWRQIIPYVVITHGQDVFTLQRTAKQSESRLHHKISLGIGGHVNPGYDLLAGLHKELEEEVGVADSFKLEFAGVLNDESTEVGRVHLGAVHLLSASTANVSVRETEKMTGRWHSRDELAAMREAMESWSQIVYDALLS